MGKLKDLTGQRFGRLTVIEIDEYKGRLTTWRCKCDCGKYVVRRGETLRKGRSHSCGCLKVEASTKHGLKNTRLYRIWGGMKNRCYNPRVKAFPNYGGRGIKICDEWLADFVNFYNWAMANGYDNTKSIDRIDNDGNYEPSNCRWTGITDQQNNRRCNIMLEFKGKVQTAAEWADELGIPRGTIYDRIKKGWTIEEALTTLKGEKRRST